MNEQSGPTVSAFQPIPKAWQTSTSGARRGSMFFWTVILCLGCLALVSTIWAASAILAKKGSEKILRVDLILPKLKSSHGERKVDAFRMSEPESSELAHPKERKIPLPPLGVAMAIDQPKVKIEEMPVFAPFAVATHEPPALNLIKPIDLTPPLLEACGEPVIYQHPCAPQPGDSPMMRNWKTLTMFSLLSAATFSYVPTPIHAGGEKASAKIEGIEELQNSMKELLRKVTALENKKLSAADQEAIAESFRTELKKLENGPLAGLQSEQTKLRAEMDGQKVQIKILSDELISLNKKLLAVGPAQTPAVDKTFMEQLNNSLKTLNETIAKLGPTEKRMSMSLPNGSQSNLGRVVLVNLYSQDLLFTINGLDYRVAARTTRMIDNVPTGALRYEVFSDRWGTLERQTANIGPNDTYTVTASNR